MNVENAIAHALKYLDGWKHQHEEAQKEPNLLERVELLHQAGNVYHRYEGAKNTLIELGVPREIFVEEENKVFFQIKQIPIAEKIIEESEKV